MGNGILASPFIPSLCLRTHRLLRYYKPSWLAASRHPEVSKGLKGPEGSLLHSLIVSSHHPPTSKKIACSGYSFPPLQAGSITMAECGATSGGLAAALSAGTTGAALTLPALPLPLRHQRTLLPAPAPGADLQPPCKPGLSRQSDPSHPKSSLASTAGPFPRPLPRDQRFL